VIIISGMDNSGKTTLATALGRVLIMPVIHSPGPLPLDDQIQWVIAHMGMDAIFDRFPLIEELVYGPVLRGHSNFNPDDPLFCELGHHQPLIIYARPHRDRILNFGNRGQMNGVKERAIALIGQYDRVMDTLSHSGWKVRAYNYDIESPRDMVKYIREEQENGSL
jgi:hypothetical protein